MRSFTALLLIASCLIAEEPGRPTLKALYEARRWVELDQALHGQKGQDLFRGAVAAVFGDIARASPLLHRVIASAPRSEDAYEAYEWLAHIYLRTGRYRRYEANMESRWAAFPQKKNIPEERKATAGFKGLPDQIDGTVRRATLAHEHDSIFVSVVINKGAATYFFDTGAWVNCISESEAERLGLKIREADGTLNTSTGNRVGFRTAVATEVIVGNMRFKDVSFVVFRDDQEPWSLLPVGRRGLLGMPILLGLRTLRWTPEQVEIGMKSKPADPNRANLFFDDDHLVAAGQLGKRKLLATLDTGAESTDLYAGFAKEFPALMEGGKQDGTEVRGVGHAETFDSITLPEVKFQLGGRNVALRPVHVLLTQIGSKCCVGNFGLDLLKQGRGFTIDFGAMRLEIEAGMRQ